MNRTGSRSAWVTDAMGTTARGHAPMRLALVVPGGVHRSGQQDVIPVLLWLIERLARRHAVHVFSLYQYPEPCTYELRGAVVQDLAAPLTSPRLTTFSMFRSFMRAVRAAGPFDVIHGFWAAPSGLLAAAAGRRLGIPSVVSLAGGELVGFPDIGYGMQLHPHGRRQVGMALRLATCVTASTRYMRTLASAHGVTAHPLPLGVDTASFVPGARSEGPPWRLLHVASLNRVKDQMTLLQALRRVVDRVSEVFLDIVGTDTLGGALQAYAARLGLEHQVRFHGFLPSAELVPLYHRAHLFVLPSRHDAAPVVALEAASCGVPVVGTDVGYVSEWAPEGAMAVPVGDAAALATGILELLGEPERRSRMARLAAEWSRAHDADATARQVESLYASLMRPTVRSESK